MDMSLKNSCLTALLSLGLVATAAQAADPVVSTNIQVDASIVPGCLIRNASAAGSESSLDGRDDIEWGSIAFSDTPAAGGGANVDAALLWNQSVIVACTPGIDLTMSIDGGNTGQRKLQNTQDPAQTLSYYLFKDSQMTAASEIPINGDGVSISDGSTDYENITLPIFARVMLPEVATSGTYTDTIRVTLAW